MATRDEYRRRRIRRNYESDTLSPLLSWPSQSPPWLLPKPRLWQETDCSCENLRSSKTETAVFPFPSRKECGHFLTVWNRHTQFCISRPLWIRENSEEATP